MKSNTEGWSNQQLNDRIEETEELLGNIRKWAECQLEESSMIAEAKYEAFMAGKDESSEMNYFAGARDHLQELLMLFDSVVKTRHQEFLEKCIEKFTKLISNYPFCFAEFKHLAAYGADDKLIEDTKFAIDKYVPKAGWMYMPIQEGDTIIVVRSSKETTKTGVEA